ncbi:MAG: 2-hydroxyisocaproyl-CoA dehydratase activator [Syntrophus sp. SKADARSKE-3]|nr:2-hydroxyisocaproyl-CoA dehydratase activator [Syntrophus sp. SKADARSKE-3]
MPFAGIDIGSTMTKAVILDDKEKILASVIGPTGVKHRHLALEVMKEACGKAGSTMDALDYVLATGYGRINVPFADKQMTEITCHGQGIFAIFPTARIIIDIGGQDSKGIRLDDAGKVANFVMNDKCAAGTGRFLEVIAETLGVELADLGNISLAAKGIVKISNMCTVFAEHEVTSRLSEGAAVPDIVAGLHEAIAGRIVNMVRHLGIQKDVIITGGGAKNIGLVKAIEDKIGFPALVPPEPLITGALGAALLGKVLAARGVVRDHKRNMEEVTFFK